MLFKKKPSSLTEGLLFKYDVPHQLPLMTIIERTRIAVFIMVKLFILIGAALETRLKYWDYRHF